MGGTSTRLYRFSPSITTRDRSGYDMIALTGPTRQVSRSMQPLSKRIEITFTPRCQIVIRLGWRTVNLTATGGVSGQVNPVIRMFRI